MKNVNQAATPETFVAYYRVSTKEQGQSGLGLEAQQKAVKDYVESINGIILKEFTEVASGKTNNRPLFIQAKELARKSKARLLSSTQDRLSRNASLILNLLEDGTKIRCADSPNDDDFIMLIKAGVAQEERKKIAQRTKAALAAAKARGVKLGNPNINLRNDKIVEDANNFAESLRTTLTGYKRQGLSERKMVEELNRIGIKTIRGKEWNPAQIHHTLKRLNLNG